MAPSGRGLRVLRRAGCCCGRFGARRRLRRLKPVVRKLRFHDLRHTMATLLVKAKVPLAIVQRILRHTDPKVTSEVYGHLDLDD
ncbi:MAG: hypothetical protein E6J58_24180, partial [Deltaproteobacteria bacterium]